MNIIFIVPNTESLAAAGVRIRYKRLEPFFNKNNCLIKIIPLQNITCLALKSADVVILSKIYTVDSLHIISLCHTLKVKVGIDLFDDYFTDKNLSVFRKLQDWLKLASNIVDFIICSTDRMKDIASEYIRPELVHKINDTKDPNVEFKETHDLLDKKINCMSPVKQLNILWFGIGDNPYFSVGINDLSNYSNALFRINKLSPFVSLTILTNERALTAKNLIKVSGLPIQTKLEIWSESKEIEYLKNTHIAFMPVSHQSFSIAKSSNRCLTALTYGCQVLSNGYNLYDQFASLIYTSTRDFETDFKNSSFKFNPKTMPTFRHICTNLFDCEAEVVEFINFIESKVSNAVPKDQIRFCIVHTKPYTLKFCASNPLSQFPVIDGSRFSLTNSNNFGIEKYGDDIYFVFANSIENLLLEVWHQYLQVKYIEESRPLCFLSIMQVENLVPGIKQDLHIVKAARFTERSSDTFLRSIQSETYQSVCSSPIRNIVKILFGFNNMFFSDFQHTVPPIKVGI